MSRSAHELPFVGGSSPGFQYRLSTVNTPPPGSGLAATDTTLPGTATRLFLSYFNVSNEVIAPLLRIIRSGGLLVVQDTLTVTAHAEFSVVADAIDYPAQAYVEVPVTASASTITGKSNQRITIFSIG